MTNNKRNHHYVSQFYLEGFVNPEGKKLHVFDLTRKKYFETIPRNVASQRDYNRIEVPGKENAIEDALGGFEGEASVVFKNIINNGKPCDHKELSTLLNFICLMVVKNPIQREQSDDFQKRLCEMLMDMILSSKERYETHIKNLEQETGDKINLSYEEMKEFHRKKEYTLEIRKHNNVISEIEIINELLPTFFARKWTFLISNAEVGEFISSDHPVSLFSNKSNRFNGIGYGMKNTEVAFPVARFVAMLGLFEDKYPPEVNASRRIVENINGRTLRFAKNQIYSTNDDFCFVDKNGGSCTGRQLIMF